MTRKALTLATLLPSSATSSKLRVGFEETPSVDIAIDDLNVEHNIEARRFEIHYGDEMARLEYRLHAHGGPAGTRGTRHRRKARERGARLRARKWTACCAPLPLRRRLHR